MQDKYSENTTMCVWRVMTDLKIISDDSLWRSCNVNIMQSIISYLIEMMQVILNIGKCSTKN